MGLKAKGLYDWSFYDLNLRKCLFDVFTEHGIPPWNLFKPCWTISFLKQAHFANLATLMLTRAPTKQLLRNFSRQLHLDQLITEPTRIKSSNTARDYHSNKAQKCKSQNHWSSYSKLRSIESKKFVNANPNISSPS